MSTTKLTPDFLEYLAKLARNGQTFDLPSLSSLSKSLGISLSTLREQLEVAKALGFVDIRPRTGMRLLPYSFSPAVSKSLSYAIELDPDYFAAIVDLRNHLEAAYWHEAVCLLSSTDKEQLGKLITQAWAKLHGSPIQIPHMEHRQLHLSIYQRLQNPFVIGIMEAYWDAYERVGLSLYADYLHLKLVWTYHQEMVEAICQGDFDAGYSALVKHKDLLLHLPITSDGKVTTEKSIE